MRRRWRWLPSELRQQIIRLAATGATNEEIRLAVDVAVGTVTNVLRPLGGVIRRDVWEPSGARLSLEDRVEVRIKLEVGWSFRRIGEWVGRAASTVSREVNANRRPQGLCADGGAPASSAPGAAAEADQAGQQRGVARPGSD